MSIIKNIKNSINKESIIDYAKRKGSKHIVSGFVSQIENYFHEKTKMIEEEKNILARSIYCFIYVKGGFLKIKFKDRGWFSMDTDLYKVMEEMQDFDNILKAVVKGMEAKGIDVREIIENVKKMLTENILQSEYNCILIHWYNDEVVFSSVEIDSKITPVRVIHERIDMSGLVSGIEKME